MNEETKTITLYFEGNRFQDADTCQLYYISDLKKLSLKGYRIINASSGETWTYQQLAEYIELGIY